MIDVHSHIAWGVDDGLQNEQEARLALEMAKDDGIDTILSTPHFTPGESEEYWPLVYKRQKELRRLARKMGIQVKIACEIMMNEHFIPNISRYRYPAINQSRYWLVEFNVLQDLRLNRQANDCIYEVLVNGHIPLLAHAERYYYENLDLDQIQNWVDQGVCIQINRTSLLGYHGRQNEKNAWSLIENGLAHIVATDTHHVEGARIMKLSDAREKLEKRVGVEAARLLLEENPRRLLADEPLLKVVPEKKSWFQRLVR